MIDDRTGQRRFYRQSLERVDLGDVLPVDIELVLIGLDDDKLFLIPANMPSDVAQARIARDSRTERLWRE